MFNYHLALGPLRGIPMRTFKIFLNTFFRLTHLSYNHLITDTHPQPPSLPFEKFLTNCVYSDSTLTHS